MINLYSFITKKYSVFFIMVSSQMVGNFWPWGENFLGNFTGGNSLIWGKFSGNCPGQFPGNFPPPGKFPGNCPLGGKIRPEIQTQFPHNSRVNSSKTWISSDIFKFPPAAGIYKHIFFTAKIAISRGFVKRNPQGDLCKEIPWNPRGFHFTNPRLQIPGSKSPASNPRL